MNKESFLNKKFQSPLIKNQQKTITFSNNYQNKQYLQNCCIKTHKHCKSNCPDHNKFATSLRKYDNGNNSTARLSTNIKKRGLSEHNLKTTVNVNVNTENNNNYKKRQYSAKYIRPFKQVHQQQQDAISSIKDQSSHKAFNDLKIKQIQKNNRINTGKSNKKEIQFLLIKETLNKDRNKLAKNMISHTKQYQQLIKTSEKNNLNSNLNYHEHKDQSFIIAEVDQYQKLKKNFSKLNNLIQDISKRFNQEGNTNSNNFKFQESSPVVMKYNVQQQKNIMKDLTSNQISKSDYKKLGKIYTQPQKYQKHQKIFNYIQIGSNFKDKSKDKNKMIQNTPLSFQKNNLIHNHKRSQSYNFLSSDKGKKSSSHSNYSSNKKKEITWKHSDIFNYHMK